MSQIGRLRFVWTGYSGAPGLSTFYFSGTDTSTFSATDAANARTAVETFFTAIRTKVATGITIASDGTCETIDPVSGAVVGSVYPGAPIGISGGGGPSSAPLSAAACISWVTGVSVNRRILRGRTFLSPLVPATWLASGTLDPSAVTQFVNAANALIADTTCQLVIWHRPNPLKSGNNGLVSPALTAKMNATGAVLRSRRQ